LTTVPPQVGNLGTARCSEDRRFHPQPNTSDFSPKHHTNPHYLLKTTKSPHFGHPPPPEFPQTQPSESVCTTSNVSPLLPILGPLIRQTSLSPPAPVFFSSAQTPGAGIRKGARTRGLPCRCSGCFALTSKSQAGTQRRRRTDDEIVPSIFHCRNRNSSYSTS
jgi:hypothetical protein